MTDLACVYAIRRPDGAMKIGYSNSPVVRTGVIACERDERLELMHTSRQVENAPDVEAHAHWLLRDHHLGGEWFSITPSAAIEAIAQAEQLALAGEPLPRRINNATPFAELKGERLALVLSADLMADLDAWCFANHVFSRSEAVRRFIVKGVEAERTSKR